MKSEFERVFQGTRKARKSTDSGLVSQEIRSVFMISDGFRGLLPGRPLQGWYNVRSVLFPVLLSMSFGLLKSSAVVSAMTLISRVLGFVRDMVIAVAFGASGATDAFFVAFKIPNFLRRLFAEGAFATAFVPVLSEYRETRSREEVKDLVDHVAGTLMGVLLLITTVGVLAAPWLVLGLATGFAGDEDKVTLAGDMLRITFPYLLFIALTALAGGVLNSYGRFAVPAFTPVLLNLCLIGAALWLAPELENPIVGLAWGVFLAGAAQLSFQLPFLWRLGLLPRPRWGWRHSGVRKIIALMLPTLFGSSVAQINLLFDVWLASFLVEGSISWLYYSDRLMEFPLGVLAIAIATVILPQLSRDHAGRTGAFSRVMDWALRLMWLVGLPAALGLFLLAGPLLSTLFQHGEFTPGAVEMSALSLMAYALGLPAFMAIKVLAPGYFARRDTKTPVRIGLYAMGANMVLNLILVWPLDHVGLALATTLSAYLNAALLYRGLRRSGVYVPGRDWRAVMLRMTAALAAMGVLLYWGTPALEWWVEEGAWSRLWTLSAWIAAGAGVYSLSLALTGLRPRHLRL